MKNVIRLLAHVFSLAGLYLWNTHWIEYPRELSLQFYHAMEVVFLVLVASNEFVPDWLVLF